MQKPSVNIDECLFFREKIVNLDAGMIGISRSNWTVIYKDTSTREEVIKLMQENRFDVLPIVTDERVTGFFQTSHWSDYLTPVRRFISYKDVIPLQTHVRDLIKNFVMDNRLFYFLTNENRIAGLVTIADLNCRQVRTYLYSMLCELEVGLSGFLSKYISEKELLEMTMEGLSWGKRYEITKKRFIRNRNAGVELRFVEYLYLSDFILIINKKGLHNDLNYSESEFTEKLCLLNDLRNVVSHPNRSIITRVKTVKNLWTCIDLLEDVLFRLRQEMECVVSC